MRLRLLLAICGLLASSFVLTSPARAEATATWHGDIDGVPAWITVIPHGHEVSTQVREQQPWWEWGNTSTDSYLFAFERPEDVLLILEFTQLASSVPQARLYINEGGSKRLNYVLSGDHVQVHTNAGHPYLMLQPLTGTWYQGNQVNYHLLMSVDGSLLGTDFGNPHAATDGTIDIQSEIGGTHPGVPEWQTFYVVSDPHPNEDLYRRFSAWERMPNSPPFKVAPPLMPTFPYIGMGQHNIDWNKENRNPLYFNLTSWQLQVFPFPGFETGGLYHINSSTLPPEVTFEAPFVFYNFDSSTRLAQLVIRADYHPSDDPFTSHQTLNNPYSSFRYSWKSAYSNLWSYSLNVAGSYTLDQSVQLGDSQFWSIAPDQLPGWIVSRKWNMATFVEAVNGYQGGEGIYFYSTQAIQNWPWLYGASTDQPQYLTQPYLQPTANLEEKSVMGLPTNFRGEYSSAYFRQPRLYFSPIDNRLHLLYGQGGVWNLGQGLVLRLQNLEGAAFVDSWIRERLSTDQLKSATLQAVPGYTEEALYALGGYLIYAGGGNVEFGPLVESSSRFVISPPGDKSSWLAFRERIAQYSGQERSPMDLESWLLALHGPTFALSGAQLEDMRAMPGGFRFLLDLQPGFQGRGEDLLDAASLSPGRYVVTYQGRFRVEKLTPPSLTASIVGAGSLLMEKNPVRVLLSNHGLQDAEQATVELLARSPGGGGKIVAAQTVDLLAGDTLAITLSWTPATTGIWMLTPLIRESDGSVVFGDAVSAVVFAPKNSGLNALLLTTASRGRLPVILAVLLILAGFGALQLWRNWGRMLGTGKRR